MAQTMMAKNSVSAKMAECYIRIGDKRYNAMNAVKVEVTFEKSKSEIAILGRMNKGHKSVGSSITGTAEFHFNTSIWRELAYDFQETGEDVYFDMTISNNDITASDVGTQTIVLEDCNFDSVILASFDASSDDALIETLDFTAERFYFGNKQKFNTNGGMVVTTDYNE